MRFLDPLQLPIPHGGCVVIEEVGPSCTVLAHARLVATAGVGPIWWDPQRGLACRCRRAEQLSWPSVDEIGLPVTVEDSLGKTAAVSPLRGGKAAMVDAPVCLHLRERILRFVLHY